MAEFVALCIGLFGVAGVIFTALRYNRDDTTAIVSQQSAIVGELKELSGELRLQRDEAKARCDECLAEVARLRA